MYVSTRAGLCKCFIQCMLRLCLYTGSYLLVLECLIYVFNGLVELGAANRVTYWLYYIYSLAPGGFIWLFYGAALLCSRPVPQSPRIPRFDS